MQSGENKQLTIRDLLKPHLRALLLGMLAAMGGAVANLLEPFPCSGQCTRSAAQWMAERADPPPPAENWPLWNSPPSWFGNYGDWRSPALEILSTKVGQWVLHDLRQRLYFHIQRPRSPTTTEADRDLISRVTSDIDSIQASFPQNCSMPDQQSHAGGHGGRHVHISGASR
jgi:subfamily B ATP-binding cassette protein MsbA